MVGTWQNKIILYENKGETLGFEKVALDEGPLSVFDNFQWDGSTNSEKGEAAGGAAPAAADVDGDGDMDIVIGFGSGRLHNGVWALDHMLDNEASIIRLLDAWPILRI